ncbi:MAG: AEC family transporter [Pseudomonadota bacterium]
MLRALADPILPVFAIMAIGYLGGRTARITADEARLINRFAMTVLLPIFVFRAMALAPWELFDPAALLSYASAQAVIYALGYWIIRRGFGMPRAEALLLAFCGVFANNAYYGLPIAQFLFGVEAAFPVTAVVILDATLAFGGTMIALEVMAGRDAGAGLGVVLRQIAKLPLIWALAAGIGFGTAGLPLTGSLDTFTAFVGQAASPVALFALGVILAATPLQPEPVTFLVSTVKIIVLPLVVWAILTVTAPGEGKMLYVFAAAGPAGAMGASMALLYGVRTVAIMQVTILTSVLTLFSLAYLG